jgi:adenylate cyclase
MQPKLSQRLTESMYALAAESDDTLKLKASKIQMVRSMLMSIPNLVAWSLAYLYFAEIGAFIILASYALGLVCLLVLMRFRLLRNSRIPNIYIGFNLMATFLATLALGGIANSTGLFFLVLLSPFSVITARPTRQFVGALVLSIGLVGLEIALQPWLRSSNNIPLGVSTIFWGLNFFTLCGLLYGNLIAILRERDTTLQLLHAEQLKSENLLLNILPSEIAQALKNESRTIAEHIEHASVLFADVVNFTPISASMTPTELVELLNEVYSYFDTLVEKYNLEKIKTIGDCYMVAAGVPRRRSDHAIVITQLALDIRDYVSKHEFHGHQLKFRIGINSGSLVAGVIGRKKFAYDLWGDTVNTASRMESHGSGGFIQITEDTYNLVYNYFNCELRGKVNVKGKGEISVWYVIDKLS